MAPSAGDGPYVRSRRRPLVANLVAVLDHAIDGRALRLIDTPSRVIRAGDIHEIVVTAERGVGPGATVNDVAIVGFAEFAQGGVLVAGDAVEIGGRELGRVVGFDESHAPNHLNVVVGGARRVTGVGLDLAPGELVTFRHP